MWIANALGGVTVLLFGLIVRFMKVSWLIAGYNTMSKEEKAKYDEEALTRFVGNLLIVASAIVLLPLVAFPFIDDPAFLVTASWVLFTVFLVGGVIFANTGNRFRKR